MEPNPRPPFFYESQTSLPLGLDSKGSVVPDTSSYNTGMGIYSLPTATPAPLAPVPSHNSAGVMTLNVHYNVTDVVIVVGRMGWQCYMCNETHDLSISIDKHLSLKHQAIMGVASNTGIQQNVYSSSRTEAKPLPHSSLTYQDCNIQTSNHYTGNEFIASQHVPAAIAVTGIDSEAKSQSQPQTLSTTTTIGHMLTVSPPEEGSNSSRSGLEREVALLMAQTFTQSNEMSSSWDNGNKEEQQSAVPAEEAGQQDKTVALTELARTDGQNPGAPTPDDDLAKGVILGKMINNVEKAIPAVADASAKSGLFLVATELARMKKQTKSKRMLLRAKYRYINCPVCGKEVRNRKAYIAQHNRSHEKGKNFHCSVCNKMFKYKSTLRRHVQQQGHKGGMDEDSNSAAPLPSMPQWDSSNTRQEDSGATNSYATGDTAESFQDNESKVDVDGLSSDKQAVHGKAEAIPDDLLPPGEPAYQRILSTLLIRGEQARSSTGKKLSLVQCFVCDREIRNRNYYITRHARCHMQDVVYTCRICQMQFFRRDFFKLHVQQHGLMAFSDGATFIEVGVKEVKEEIAASEQQLVPQSPAQTFASSAASSAASSMTTIDATAIATEPDQDEPFQGQGEQEDSPVSKTNASSTVPCKICGKEIFNRTLNIKRHAQQHSIFEWETILSKPDTTAELKEECHPVQKVVGSPASSRLKFTATSTSPVAKASAHQYRCHVCSKQFKSYVKKRRHVMQHGTTFTCPVCWEKFDNYTQYRAHQQECKKPGSAFEEAERKALHGPRLRRHKRGQREKKEKYTCSQCDAQIINTKASIARHMRELHSDGERHTCHKCFRVYDSYHKLQRHMKSHGDTGGICDVCGKVFLTKQALRNHTKLHAGPEGMYQCSRCPKSFRFQGLLDRHMRKHKEDTDICPHCGKVYISKVHLQRHISVVHLGVKDYRFKCDQCGAQFFESIQLRDHIAYRHQGIQLYQCRFCKKGFNCRPTMVRHERKMHTGYLPYVCKHCGQGFPEKSKLVSHEMTHTGVSPHKCEVCGKYFTTGSALKTHKNLHLGLKPYGCSICGRAYIKRWHLQQHLRKSHNAMGVAWQEITGQSGLQPEDHLVIQQAEEHLTLHPADTHLTLHQPDGQLTLQQTDAPITVHQADGHLTLHQQDGHLTLHQPDGGQLVHPTDGQLVHSTEGQLVHSTDGQLVHPTEGQLVHPTDSQLVHSADGQLIHQADGQLVHSSDGQLLVQQADGHITVHQSLEHISVQHPNIVYH